ncbi:MAG: hypothetical protein AAF827_03970 [Cyanobacteria bacterium P01_D01_bin.6]
MPATEIRPWRLVLLFSGVFMLTAYMPHPNLGESLPKSIGNWLHDSADESVVSSES